MLIYVQLWKWTIKDNVSFKRTDDLLTLLYILFMLMYSLSGKSNDVFVLCLNECLVKIMMLSALSYSFFHITCWNCSVYCNMMVHTTAKNFSRQWDIISEIPVLIVRSTGLTIHFTILSQTNKKRNITFCLYFEII